MLLHENMQQLLLRAYIRHIHIGSCMHTELVTPIHAYLDSSAYEPVVNALLPFCMAETGLGVHVQNKHLVSSAWLTCVSCHCFFEYQSLAYIMPVCMNP